MSNHLGWVEDASSWQASARDLEDRLSDALHQRLILRFVDRGRAGQRGAVTRPRPREGAVRAANQREARALDDQATTPAGPFAKLLALRRELAEHAAPRGPADGLDDDAPFALAEAPHEALDLDPRGGISFRGVRVGTLVAGRELLLPDARATLGTRVAAGTSMRIERRLQAFARDVVAEICAPLRAIAASTGSSALRGVVWQLERRLGTLRVAQVQGQLALLGDEERAALDAAGVVVGDLLVIATSMLRGRAAIRRVAIAGTFYGLERTLAPPSAALPRSDGGHVRFALPPPSTTSVRAASTRRDFWEAVGYPVFGPRAIRADAAERAYGAASRGEPIFAIVGCKKREEGAIVEAMWPQKPLAER